MGYDAYSKMVIGYEIDKDQAVQVEEKRGCRCKLSDKELEGKFCPHCGKKIKELKNVRTRDLLEEAEDFDFDVEIESCDSDNFYVGKIIESVLYLDDLQRMDFEAMAQELADELERFGIVVNTEDFGIHNFLYESY